MDNPTTPIISHIISDNTGLDEVRIIECRETVRMLDGCQHEFILLGGTVSEATCTALDMPPTIRIPWSKRSSRSTSTRLRRYLSTDSNQRKIICWDEIAHKVARAAGHRSIKLVPECDLSSLPPVHSDPENQRIITRSELGIEPDTPVIIAVSGRPGDVHGWQFVYAVVLSTLAMGRPVVGIVPSGAMQLDRGVFNFERSQVEARLVVTERPISSLLCAADVGVYAGCAHVGVCARREVRARADARAQAMAMRSGIPVVMPRGALGVDPHGEELGHVCLSNPDVPPDLVSKIVGMLGDRKRLEYAQEVGIRNSDPDGFVFRASEIAPMCVRGGAK